MDTSSLTPATIYAGLITLSSACIAGYFALRNSKGTVDAALKKLEQEKEVSTLEAWIKIAEERKKREEEAVKRQDETERALDAAITRAREAELALARRVLQCTNHGSPCQPVESEKHHDPPS